MLERVGLSVQQDPLPSPQSSVRGRRFRPVSGVPCWSADVVSNGWSSGTQRHQRSPETLDEEDLEEVHLGRDRSSSPSASISSVATPTELSASSLVRSDVEVSPPQTPFTPSPPASSLVRSDGEVSAPQTPFTPSPPPAAPRHRRRVCRLPVLTVNFSGAGQFFYRQGTPELSIIV